jgi:hypothetical protein
MRTTRLDAQGGAETDDITHNLVKGCSVEEGGFRVFVEMLQV